MDCNLYLNFTAEYFLREEKLNNPINTIGNLYSYSIYSPLEKWV